VNACSRLLALLAVLLSAACASPGVSSGRRAGNTPPPPPPVPIPGDLTDPSFDWHGLVVVPFGVLLKDSPVPLHEVLLFHDEANRVESENKDCFSIEGTLPRFLGQRPDPYLLCFDHDRLSRIDAAVRLPADEAPAAFVRACALWLKDTASTMRSGTACEGLDSGVKFSARLGPAAADGAETVSIILTAAAAREPASGAPLAQ